VGGGEANVGKGERAKKKRNRGCSSRERWVERTARLQVIVSMVVGIEDCVDSWIGKRGTYSHTAD